VDDALYGQETTDSYGIVTWEVPIDKPSTTFRAEFAGDVSGPTTWDSSVSEDVVVTSEQPKATVLTLTGPKYLVSGATGQFTLALNDEAGNPVDATKIALTYNGSTTYVPLQGGQGIIEVYAREGGDTITAVVEELSAEYALPNAASLTYMVDVPVSLTLTGPQYVNVNQAFALNGSLLINGTTPFATPAGVVVRSIDGLLEKYVAVNADGTFLLTTVIGVQTTFVAQYTDDVFHPSTVSDEVVVSVPGSTVMTITGPYDVRTFEPQKYAFKLTADGLPLPGLTIAVTVADSVGKTVLSQSYTTGTDGTAYAEIAFPAADTYTLRGVFAGTTDLAQTSAMRTLSTLPPELPPVEPNTAAVAVGVGIAAALGLGYMYSRGRGK
jgi:hypothetical protein